MTWHGRRRGTKIDRSGGSQLWPELLKGISLPTWDLDEFCARLADSRGRDLIVHKVPLNPELSGLWIPTPDADVVMVEQDTTPAHQEHILCHEIAHMLLGHLHDPQASTIWSQRLAPSLDVDAVRMTLIRARTSYDEHRERDAEALASYIPHHRGPRATTGDLVASVEETFG